MGAPHSGYRSACSYNSKVWRYNSRFYQLGTEAVDAFTQNWDGENNWILSLVSQISKVIAIAGACKTVGTVVIPKTSYFWLLLCEDGKHWNAFVCDWVTLPKFKNLFVKGKAKNHVFCSKDLSFSVVALRLMFMQPRWQLFSGFCTADGGRCSQCNNC